MISCDNDNNRYNMSSFVQTNEEILDFNSIKPKVKQQSKAFAFFIYYNQSASNHSPAHLQKLTFSIKETKNYGLDKQYFGKVIHIHFVDLDCENDVQQSFFELKMQILQSLKTKLIFYSQEHHFVDIISRAKSFGIDIALLSSAIYSPDLHEDLTQHLGWKEPFLGDLSQKSTTDFQQNVQKWISSPGERIDMWTTSISVDSQHGSIHKMDHSNNTFMRLEQKQINQHFISHVCLGHHAELAANYQSNRKQHGSSVNRLIFGFQSFKKFCCLGTQSLEDSTGIVSIFYEDQKGHSQEITKQLVQQGSKRGAVSLLLTNIDKFMGMKLPGGRMNDNRLQMGVCQSSKQFRLMGSAGGKILIRLNSTSVFMSIGSNCYKLLHPKQIQIQSWGKVKLLMSRQSLQC